MLRIIARLNLGGPAHHVSILSGKLDPARFQTLLVAGELGPGEGSLEDLAAHHGARLQHIGSMGPELHPGRDLKALLALVRVVRRFRPHIVHTHTAKAGTLGRMAARLAFRRRPVVVHTYHGHVLSGYFGPAKTELFRTIERELARFSDCLIGISDATVSELIDFRIAPPERFRVIRTGLDLDAFLEVSAADGVPMRFDLGVADDELLALFVGRLVPIKRVDVLLDAAAHARAMGAPVRLAIVGDGELRADLEAQARKLGLDEFVSFLGFRRDLPRITAAADLAVACSDNEAIPVALIEAAAAGRPAISTDVGGVSEIVPRESLVAAGDARALGELLVAAARDRAHLPARGAAARELVRDAFSYRRLIGDIEALYDELLDTRARR